MTTATAEIEAVELFNELIKTCRSGERGFTIASQAVRQPELKRLFETYAKQRRRFATELRVEVMRLGGALEISDGEFRGTHGAWPRLNAARTTDERSIIAECAVAEDESVRDYQKAESVDLRSPLRAIIDRQSGAVVAARNRIHELTRLRKKSA